MIVSELIFLKTLPLSQNKYKYINIQMLQEEIQGCQHNQQIQEKEIDSPQKTEQIKSGPPVIESNEDLSIDSQCQIPQKSEQTQKCLFCLENIEKQIYDFHKSTCEQQYLKLIDAIEMKKCSYCQTELMNQQLSEHQVICIQRQVLCKYCSQLYFPFLLDEHSNMCNMRFALSQQIDKEYQSFQRQNGVGNYFNNFCRFCEQEILGQQQIYHKYICQTRLQIQKQLQKQNLSSKEYQAVIQMYRKSSFEHLVSKERMKEQIFNMGYDKGDLLLMREYLEHQAPIIIHINLTKSIEHLLKDTHYRSLFETRTSGGSKSTNNRKAWEGYLFGSVYDNCKDSERVKYGVLNYTNDKHGIMRCSNYGQSVMVMKQHVRKRCTISHKRTYRRNQIVSTLKYCYPVLSLFEREELHTLYMASRGFQVESSHLQAFKQIHVHGPIKLDEDVECIFTSKRVKQRLAKQVAEFQSKFGVKIIDTESLMNLTQQ